MKGFCNKKYYAIFFATDKIEEKFPNSSLLKLKKLS